jgi:hypothetical protein
LALALLVFGDIKQKPVPDGSPTRKGLQSYDDYVCRYRKMDAGRLGGLFKHGQLYRGTTHKVAPFEPLAKWWSAHNYGRPAYIGHAAYHLSDQTGARRIGKTIKHF